MRNPRESLNDKQMVWHPTPRKAYGVEGSLVTVLEYNENVSAVTLHI